VIQFPFKPFGAPIQKHLFQNQEQHQDYGYSTKRTFAEVDFVVSNILSYPMVISPNWEFVKKIYSVENSNFVPKNMLGYYLLKSLAPQSIVFLEGNLWKNKRKHITKVMSFDFLKAQLPLIVQMCNQIYGTIELRDQIEDKGQ
jgi:cytochrome P450